MKFYFMEKVSTLTVNLVMKRKSFFFLYSKNFERISKSINMFVYTKIINGFCFGSRKLNLPKIGIILKIGRSQSWKIISGCFLFVEKKFGQYEWIREEKTITCSLASRGLVIDCSLVKETVLAFRDTSTRVPNTDYCTPVLPTKPVYRLASETILPLKSKQKQWEKLCWNAWECSKDEGAVKKPGNWYRDRSLHFISIMNYFHEILQYQHNGFICFDGFVFFSLRYHVSRKKHWFKQNRIYLPSDQLHTFHHRNIRPTILPHCVPSSIQLFIYLQSKHKSWNYLTRLCRQRLILRLAAACSQSKKSANEHVFRFRER